MQATNPCVSAARALVVTWRLPPTSTARTLGAEVARSLSTVAAADGGEVAWAAAAALASPPAGKGIGRLDVDVWDCMLRLLKHNRSYAQMPTAAPL